VPVPDHEGRILLSLWIRKNVQPRKRLKRLSGRIPSLTAAPERGGSGTGAHIVILITEWYNQMGRKSDGFGIRCGVN